ncbi:MAG: hypothetical protein AB1571_03555 [Nanoarchaeota archaeon]
MKLKKILMLVIAISLIYVSTAANNVPSVVPFEPKDTSIIHEQLQRFSWNFYDSDNDKQVAYEIAVADNYPFYNAITKLKTSSNTSTTLALDGAKTYYWHVRAYDGKDWSKWSEVQTFTLQLSLRTCKDGTLFFKCNSKSQYCDSGFLIDDCDKCGCPEGYECLNKKCIEEKCPDGTPYKKCNTDLKYCHSGNLIDNCQVCGCPDSLICSSDNTCIEQKIEMRERTLFQIIIDFLKRMFS